MNWNPAAQRLDNFPLNLGASVALARCPRVCWAGAVRFVGYAGTDFNTSRLGEVTTLSLNIRGNPLSRRGVAGPGVIMTPSVIRVTGG